MKDPSITDEDIRLNKIRQVNQPNQRKYFHKQVSGKERKIAVTNSNPFLELFKKF